ncbi:cytochrome c oxidase subunit 6C-like [Coccinella septempunctata]|uniref:cytochrome c oxidase subunit 6C-like n=1 Tax=Coccinella septempunctata TaxID=41139 RepID=UPI001D086095|nr:cytochrome c oxidase subunit 6C-like [Coccinella septempunctata]
MAGDKVLPKPQLRGLLRSQIKVNLIVMSVIAVGAVALQKVFINDRRKQVYADFYKNYDIDKEFERMKAKGLFDSC